MQFGLMIVIIIVIDAYFRRCCFLIYYLRTYVATRRYRDARCSWCR